ncbi:hypothetical protein [Pelobacter propionicus]|uniref:Uncharacterized protein n=1 Tax=Pelobacter propionicus (strain DSM 2379 / NBRC 103807 / OttBd1) TaxID=338966 RepID=A1ANR6_PELPD|nr:hypothetical protein [Pelobacter propionicus]ABK98986.1 hypothetical protein Ppro_1370 [Pelobacter propionicus DSM 2379]
MTQKFVETFTLMLAEWITLDQEQRSKAVTDIGDALPYDAIESLTRALVHLVKTNRPSRKDVRDFEIWKEFQQRRDETGQLYGEIIPGLCESFCLSDKTIQAAVTNMRKVAILKSEWENSLSLQRKYPDLF